MNGGTKLLIGIAVIVLLYIIWDYLSKKKTEEEKKKAEDDCIKLDPLEYGNIKKDKVLKIKAQYVQLAMDYINAFGTSPASVVAQNPMNLFVEKYRSDAINKGGVLPNTNATNYNIQAYGFNIEADKEMAAEGYCFINVGRMDATPGDSLYD